MEGTWHTKKKKKPKMIYNQERKESIKSDTKINKVLD